MPNACPGSARNDNRSSDDCWLLVSDIDDTLTGDDLALRRFIQTVEQAGCLIVALNSSRPAGSVDETLRTVLAPLKPRAIITAMGTELQFHGKFVDSWTQTFQGWNRELVDDVMHELGFEPHAPEMQTPFKASYAVPGAEAQRLATERIEATGQPVRIITSGESNFDVLPPNAGKDNATLYLAKLLGIPCDRLIVAGDSGNDVAMFRVAGCGIVVGNAGDELCRAIDRERAYFARACHAGGVLEGLEHWGVPLMPVDVPADLTSQHVAQEGDDSDG